MTDKTTNQTKVIESKKVELALILLIVACWEKNVPAFVLSNNKMKSNYE